MGKQVIAKGGFVAQLGRERTPRERALMTELRHRAKIPVDAPEILEMSLEAIKTETAIREERQSWYDRSELNTQESVGRVDISEGRLAKLIEARSLFWDSRPLFWDRRRLKVEC